MTITEPQTVPPITPVVVDLYLNIHKGIRAELFDVTAAAGRIDPANRDARADLAARVGRTIDLLVGHAGHEDAEILPALETHLPALAEKIETDHTAIDARLIGLRALADENIDATGTTQRFSMHRVYLELASFTSAYLEHQDVEERIVMPALQSALGVEAVGEIHGRILRRIPPQEMAIALAIMLPAMNIDDRADALAGMRAGAPAEVFAGVWGLTSTLLTAPDYAALAARLDLS